MSKFSMRELSAAQAANCENAKNPECDCRCGGAAHGSARLGNLEGLNDKELHAKFEALPADDEHHLATKAEERERRRIKKQHKVWHRGETAAVWRSRSLYNDAGEYTGREIDWCPLCLEEGKQPNAELMLT